ncbi:MAG: hypothetical protein IKG17_06110 [Mogibacterium sp.]|nr:hypothetical protein [Mogibacterium sp.]
MKKKLVVLIAAAMLITSMPFYAFADDETGTEPGGQPESTETAEETTDEPEQPEPAPAPAPAVNKVISVNGKLCYYNAEGKPDMSDGWKTASDGRYYVRSGVIVTVPTKIAGTKTVTKKVKYYYNRKKKTWQKKKIKGAKTKYKKQKVTVAANRLYMFGRDGKLITTKGVFKYNGNEYCGLGGGVLKTGWAAIGKHAMYFNKNTGIMAKNRKVGYLKIPKSGRLGKAYALGVKQLDKSGWSLRKAYKFSYRIRYQGRSYRAKNSETYAIKGFTKGYGNCYVMAATFYIQAKLLGYDVHQVEGRVDLPHSWTVIRQNGRDWVYDPNFKNETGRNGWKIYYGKKGTWRYNHYHKMN